MKRLLTALILLLAACACTPASAQSTNSITNVFAPAAYTASTITSADQVNSWWVGAHVVINVTSYTSGSYTPHIQGKDPQTGAYYDILVGTPISAAGITVLKVYPGIGAIASAATPDILPQIWRVELVGASTPSMTLDVTAFLEN
jgi:hypothetical protein